MCSRCSDKPPARATVQGGRPKLWTIPREYHCSLVGTCLGPDDLSRLYRRLGLRRDPDAREYDVHRYFVQQAGINDTPAKVMHKLLDEKYSGEIRRFARAATEAEWTALWEAALAAGKVAPAYWALLTHPAMPEALKVRAFGDVHMLSHLMGGENRQHLRENQELHRRCAELDERLARAERIASEKIAEKDQRIRALEAEIQAARAATVVPAKTAGAPVSDERLRRDMDGVRRRLTVERLRARRAEEENQRLNRLLEDVVAPPQRPAACPFRAPADAAEPANDQPSVHDLNGRAILYVGGRLKMLPHIRAVVEQRNGCLLHHDGGMEQTVRGLENLVERADVVVCPIDCVSHDACLRVKGVCRRLRKPFLPIRSAGTTSFARALQTLAAG